MLFDARRDLATKHIGGDLILYDLDNKALHVLNMTAARVFHLCDGSHTPEDITKELTRTFDGVEHAQAYEDVKRTLDTLEAKELIIQKG
jgi:hypothetical protein